MITSVFIILLMLLLSAFFPGMEIAFTSKNRLKLEIDRKQSRLFNFIADIFARHPGQYITTILVGNNIALVIYSLYMSLLPRLRSRPQWVGRRSLAAGPSFWKRRFRQSSSSSSPNFSRNPFSGTARIFITACLPCDSFLYLAASDRQADDLDFPGDFVADGA